MFKRGPWEVWLKLAVVSRGPWDGKTEGEPREGWIQAIIRRKEVRAPGRDWISRKGPRGGKSYSIITISSSSSITFYYYLLSTLCVLGIVLSNCTGIASFN